jgi:MoaA/NifB/PqqE/SkfB family radical SAM enzyme
MNHASPLDLTALWRQAHPHLKPLSLAVGVDSRHFGPCPACAGRHAVTVLAHVDALAARGLVRLERLPMLVCADCGHVELAREPWQQALAQAGIDGHATPAAVDARLWSREPTFLNIEPTTRCNFNCWYCVGRHMEQADIDVNDFARVLDHFPSVKAIALVGEGEPLMHKGFFDMARMATDRGIRVLSLSNGSTFSSSNVAKLCEAGVCYISVSIDSVDPATFASSRLDGDLKQVLTGIRRLADYRDTHGYRYPRIGLKGTLFTHTEDQLPEIVRVAKEHGVDLFESFQPLNPMSTYVPIYPKDQLGQLPLVDRVSRAIARDGQAATHLLKPAASFCEEEGIRVDKNGTPNGLRPNCDEEWVYSLLSGDITPCCQIKTPPSPNWNLARRPLAEIMADPDYENTRFNLWNGLFPPYCEGCWKTRQP